MKKELTEVYCGSAKGKTTLALGHVFVRLLRERALLSFSF